MANYFDKMGRATKDNVVRDVQMMAQHECNADISDAQAAQIARTPLRGVTNSDPLYSVSPATLRRLVATLRE